MLSVALMLAALVLVVVAGTVLRTRRPDIHIRTPYLGGRHRDMVDWTLEWRRALKSLENQEASQQRARRS
jgi:hypothetical protein